MGEKEASGIDSGKKANTVKLFLCGDVMTGRGIDQVLPFSADSIIYEPYVKDARDYVRLAERANGPITKPVAYNYIWGDALYVLDQELPDCKIINLETSITQSLTPSPEKVIQYKMHPDNIDVIISAGVDICALANNHILDWGYQGLYETIATLHKANIKYAGAGNNKQETQTAASCKTPYGRVVLFSCASETSGVPNDWAATSQKQGVNLLTDLSYKTVKQIAQQVANVKLAHDTVVLSIHWGGNWGYEVSAQQREFAHAMLSEAKVDLVFGHSSHHPLGLEVFEGKLIIYGAGDFINDYEGIKGHEVYRDDLCLMYFPVICSLTGKLIQLKMVPMQIKNFCLHHATLKDAHWLARVLNRESNKFGTEVQLDENRCIKILF